VTGKDVSVGWGDPAQFPADANGAAAYLRFDSREAILALPALGGFAVRGGQEITVFSDPAADAGVLERHLVGNILAILLYQRGYLVLHASVVNIGGRAIAFLGEPGAGKSSTAAALLSQGHGLLADDTAALPNCDPPGLVVPAFPQLKLSLLAAQALGYPSDALDQAAVIDGKLILRVNRGFETQAVPLGRIYVLRRGSDFQVEPITPHQAVVEFIRHSVPVRFLQSGDAAHFGNCLRLARWLPAFRLTIPPGLSDLPRLARAIERHCGLALPALDAGPR
jgi:hypothetical protein